MDREIFFVCGALRSGSTLLHLIIDNHPKLNNPGEFDFFFDYLNKTGDAPDIRDYQSSLSTHRIYNHKGLSFPEEARKYDDVLEDFTRQLDKKDKKLVINVHRNFHHIPRYFQNAKYVHLVRDPRDVARSSIQMGWAGNVYKGVEHWMKSESAWQKLERTLDAENFIELKYEQIALEPEKHLHKLCEFLGVDYDKRMLNFYENSTYAKLDPSLTFQWKKKLSNMQIRMVEAKVGKLLEYNGYEASGLPNLKVSTFLEKKLTIQNKLATLSFKFRRYGYSIALREIVYRYLKLNKQHKIICLKMNEIELKHLK